MKRPAKYMSKLLKGTNTWFFVVLRIIKAVSNGGKFQSSELYMKMDGWWAISLFKAFLNPNTINSCQLATARLIQSYSYFLLITMDK